MIVILLGYTKTYFIITKSRIMRTTIKVIESSGAEDFIHKVNEEMAKHTTGPVVTFHIRSDKFIAIFMIYDNK